MLGYANQAARVGGIVAPLIVTASTVGGAGGTRVPFLTFGVAAALAGLLTFTLPETLGVPLPDTMQVSEARGSRGCHRLCLACWCWC